MRRAWPALLCLVLALAGPLAASERGTVPSGGDCPPSQAARAADKDLNELLETVRAAYRLPALAAAVVTDRGLEAVGAVGVRKAGTDVAVTVDDQWHLGSNTKAMTAAMIGRLVERGTLRWDSTIGEVFPELAASLTPGLRKVTILHLLSHRSGLPANTLWGLVPRSGTTRDQRLAVVKSLASFKLLSEPGAKFLYSNLGYVVAGAMAEKAADAAWEDLMRTLLFEPLGMTGAGFGGLGTPGLIDQPWPHGEGGKPVEKNGPEVDNPPVMGPAGTVHLPLSDWAKFVADLLRGLRGGKGLLKPETYQKLRTPPLGGDYALGWSVVEREWGGGTVLTHNGSNTMNYSDAWVAPERDFAVLVVCNQGGTGSFISAAKACDEAASKIIRWRAGQKD
jgi:CubicO group peptidase (beta-lactamase class C family)